MIARFIPKAALYALVGGAALAMAAPALALTKEEIAQYSKPDRQQVLEEGARKEGVVTWYSTLAVDTALKPMSQAFEKKYPYIQVKYIPLSSAPAYSRAIAEYRAKNVQVDLIAASTADSFKGTNVTQKFFSPHLADYPKNYIDPDGRWISWRSTYNAIAWNTNLVKEGPQTWESLADPKFKGKLYWSDSNGSGAPDVITRFRVMMGEEGALTFLKRLQAQDIRTAPGDVGVVHAGLLAGEYPIVIGHPAQQIAISKEKGAPISGVQPEPTMTRSSAIAVLSEPPHPYAAMLLLDFLLSKDDGQRVLSELSYIPAHPKAVIAESLRWIMPNGKKELVLPTDVENGMAEKSTNLYREMFR